MQIRNTSDLAIKPSVTALIYGQGGVGKTTFTSTAPKALLADCENGAKYFGLRGIVMDVATINTWKDIEEFYQIVKASDYETVVIDPIGELMEKLKVSIVKGQEKKFVQYDGSLTMAGWGEMKEKMRNFIKALIALNKHLILVAHVEEKDDEGKILRRPKIMTKMSEELVALVDVVGFMEVVRGQDAEGKAEDKRIIRVSPSDKYESKDRTGQLGGIIEPDFKKIIDACQGNEVFAWSSQKAIDEANAAKNPPVAVPVAPEQPANGEATPEELAKVDLAAPVVEEAKPVSDKLADALAKPNVTATDKFKKEREEKHEAEAVELESDAVVKNTAADIDQH